MRGQIRSCNMNSGSELLILWATQLWLSFKRLSILSNQTYYMSRMRPFLKQTQWSPGFIVSLLDQRQSLLLNTWWPMTCANTQTFVVNVSVYRIDNGLVSANTGRPLVLGKTVSLNWETSLSLGTLYLVWRIKGRCFAIEKVSRIVYSY